MRARPIGGAQPLARHPLKDGVRPAAQGCLLETFRVCSPIPTSEVVSVLIFIVEEVLLYVWVMSGKGARPTIHLTNYSGAPSFHQVTDAESFLV